MTMLVASRAMIRIPLPLPAVAVSLVVSCVGFPSTAARAETSGEAPRASEEVPSPEEHLGDPLGTRHLLPAAIEGYFRTLARTSPRVRLESIGRSWEGRPQLLVTITHEDRGGGLDDLRAAHLAGEADGPAVIWLGCSVHGNEPSGAHASLAVAHRLATASGDALEELLRTTVVLIDPMLNPDGLARFSTWANMHLGSRPVGDPWHREHREGWPNGRTNHYWFDLNRDWLPAVHPETRHRLEVHRRWRPHVFVDLHEMGGSPDFFFQPGVPTRQHPLTPDENLALTRTLSEEIARDFDAAGVLYYTEETFDDFYYGKGSTYPDVQGSIGILFEQAAVRGHLRDTPTGTLDFPTAIDQQRRAALALVRATHRHREDLIDYRRRFEAETPRLVEKSGLGGWVVGDDGDPSRQDAFARLLQLHGVEVHRPENAVELGGEEHPPERLLLVPADQPQFRLLRAIFERRTEFEDSTFYDVSAWTLPLAYGLPDIELDRAALAAAGVGTAWSEATSAETCLPDLGDAVAVAVDWNALGAPSALRELLEEGVNVRVATREFGDGTHTFPPGTLTVALRAQDAAPTTTLEKLRSVCVENGLRLTGLGSGLTPRGVDLGSPSLPYVERPRPALVVGEGTDVYTAGSLWHRLDHWGFALPLLDRSDLDDAELDRTTHILLPHGAAEDLPAEVVDRVRAWTEAGGVLVAFRDAAVWVDEVLRPAPEDEEKATEAEPASPPARRDWADRDAADAEREVGGAIFAVDLDPSHPLGFGYPNRSRAVLRRGRDVLRTPDDAFARAAEYPPTPLLAGYASTENLTRIARTPAVVGRPLGKGVVVQVADDPSFRGFWREGDRLLANTLFFSRLLAED